MRAYHVPVEYFLRHLKRPSWSDVDMGLRNGWLNAPAALEIAIQRIADNPNAPHTEVMLAATEPAETAEIAEQVEKLAKAESENDRKRSKQRWLYLILAWLYENRGSVEEPLAEVEEIYSDFGYPSEVAPFVRYMSSRDYRPQDHTHEENLNRLMRLWGDYVSK